MSGGHFDYNEFNLDWMADQIEDLIVGNGCEDVDSFGSKIYSNYTLDTIDKFRKTMNMLRKVAIMVRRVDYLVSCDDSEGSFHKRWEEELRRGGF